MVAGNDGHAISPCARKRAESRHLGGVRRQDAVQTGQRFSLRAAQARIRVAALRCNRLPQLERVAVEDEIRRPLAGLIDGAQKRRERVRPAEVFGGMPLSGGRILPDAEMQIADDEGESTEGRLRGRPEGLRYEKRTKEG